MLRCRDGSLYTGITNNLRKRVGMHNEGKASRYTRSRMPVVVVYVETCEDKSLALKREWEIKKLKKKQKEDMVSRVSVDPASYML
ncbi:GIY-YIG nuclease family protein [Ammoniphilus sp. YIM 78166]|uniref:GIY-YIG nuclease family protein n=1 Tax=Ammoniphilus sp. YIM 78166 TaxID=1644106 RepID=UPI00196AEC54|nr:GIY-YIG nuclease family protein [Ammoniphilus sp. YIM 78166]